MLAELMLPDQAHVRNQDWTIFFLHKDTDEEAEAKEQAKEKRRARKAERKKSKQDARGGDLSESQDEEHDSEGGSGEDEENNEEGGEGPPLIYVLNLVNTKQDTTAKRLVFRFSTK